MSTVLIYIYEREWVMIQTWTVALAFGGVCEFVRQPLESLLG